MRPTAREFFDPLIKVLGGLVGYQPGVGIPYHGALDLVLREVGVDPSSPPWPLTGAKPLGLYRIIGFAYRNQRPDIGSSRYCGKRESFCLNLGRGIWGLSSSGVERALGLSEFSFPPLIPPTLRQIEVYPPAIPPPERVLPPKGDIRDEAPWVVLELTRSGEMKVEEATLEMVLRRDLGLEPDHQVFIPAMTYWRGKRATTIQLMEGYAFVRAGLSEVEYFRLENLSTNYVKQVMSSKNSQGMRVLSVIPNSNIEDMCCQLRQLSLSSLTEGDRVRVIEGKYQNVEMKVLAVEDHEYALLETVGLRSLVIIVRLPRMFLERIPDDE